jgi:hypothetical protein
MDRRALTALGLAGVWLGAALVPFWTGWFATSRFSVFVELGLVGGFFVGALFALALAPGLAGALRTVGWLVVVAGAATTASIALDWLQPIWPYLQAGDRVGQLRLSSVETDFTPLFTLGSVCLIGARYLYRWTKARPAVAAQTRALFVLCWRQHDVVGWMLVGLAAGHSVYFLVFPRTGWIQWTGIAALAALLALAALGLVNKYGRRLRYWSHVLLAGLFVALFVLHIPALGPIGLAAIAELLVVGALTGAVISLAGRVGA